jgi:S1-C subfamily serine protease
MRHIVLAALLLSLISESVAATRKPRYEAGNLADVINRVRTSVVLIEARFPNGSSAGSGFFVSESGVVVTARHVTNPNGAVPQSIKVRLRIPTVEGPTVFVVATWSSFPATEIGHDDAHDIEILKTNPNPFSTSSTLIQSYTGPGKDVTVTAAKPTAAKLEERRLRDGEPVFASGYPLGLPILITGSGIIASSDPFVWEQQQQQQPDQAHGPVRVRDIYWADLHVNKGDSGGPLFSSVSGAVIGMTDAYDPAPVIFAGSDDPGLGVTKLPDGNEVFRPLTYNSGIAIIVPVRYIFELLRQLGIQYAH